MSLRQMITLFLITLLSLILLICVGCGKKEAENQETKKDVDTLSVVKAKNPMKVSLDTIPFRPLPNHGLMRDLSLQDDSTLDAQNAANETPAIDSFVVHVPADTQKILQLSGYPRKLDSLLAVKRTIEQSSINLKDSLVRTISNLTDLRDGLGKKKVDDEKAEEARLIKLAKLIEGMKPQQAAPMLDKLPPKVAAQIVARLKERTAGRVLAAMPLAKSSQIAMLIKSGDYQN